MDLSKLFETQRVLDARIELEHPPVEGEDRLAKKILALQIELGECANEWRGFKFWSNDQEPRTTVEIFARNSGKFIPPSKIVNPLLEEYVDCLHFILSIGLELDFNIDGEISFIENNINTHKYNDITIQFIWLGNTISQIFIYGKKDCDLLIIEFLALGVMLGFTWEQIEQAYYSKNAINHARQNTGY